MYKYKYIYIYRRKGGKGYLWVGKRPEPCVYKIVLSVRVSLVFTVQFFFFHF